MNGNAPICLLVLALLAAALVAGQDAASRPATRPDEAETRPADNLEYWLGKAAPATTQEAESQPTPSEGVNPFAGEDASRADALPGLVELSDGKLFAGHLFTTLETPWLVFVESEQRWRRIPFAACLSITAVVVEERMELQWRWKAMGEPEKVYTGRSYPYRRLKWQFRLADGSTITGTVKGQPLFVEYSTSGVSPVVRLILHERSKGEIGQKPADLVYVRRVIVSKRAMGAALKRQANSQPTSPAAAE